MNDAEYLFQQTSAERKRNGYGDFHKKRQGGRQVRLPSDHYTKKEREAMNGECLTYNMNGPVCWDTFKNWPNDIQREYLQRLDEIYRASTLDISTMMKTSYDNVLMLKQKLGIASKRGGRRRGVDKKAWAEFCDPNVLVEKCPEPTEEPAEKSPASAIIELQREAAEAEEKAKASSLGDLMNIALLLDTLKGSGAKLTIEVTL